MEDSGYLMEKKIEYLIDMKTKKLAAELSELKSVLSSALSEVSMLKGKIEHMNSQMIRPEPIAQRTEINTPIQEVRVAAQVSAPQQTVQQSNPRDSAGYNQRVGTLKPGDIDINNMFYFGNKR